MVFTKLRGVGFKLKPEKCQFLRMEIIYLDHVVSKDGVQMDEHKMEAVRKWPVPHTVMKVRSFWGFANYYCQFLKAYSSVTNPLYELVSGQKCEQQK